MAVGSAGIVYIPLPPGGTANQVLAKVDGENYNATWSNPGGGAGNTGTLSAGGNTATLGQIVFSNSNGVSFGLNGQTMTASIGAAPAAGIGAMAAGTQTATSGTILFENSNGITFGMSDSTRITAAHNGLTSQSNQALSGSNGSFTFQTATFGALNGASFYTSNGSLVLSYTVPNVPAQTNQTIGAYASSNTTGESSSSTFDARSMSFRGMGLVSVGLSAGQIVLSATQTNPVVSNAIQAVGSATGSGTNTSRFAADDHVHEGVFSAGVTNAGNTAGDTRVGPGRLVLQGGANITLSQITGAGALNTVVISAPNPGAGAGFSAGVSGGNTSGDTGATGTRVVFAGGNNITLSQATDANGASITVSGVNTVAQTNQSIGVYGSSQTTGESSSSTVDARSLSIRGMGLISVGLSAGQIILSVTQTNPVVSNAIQAVGSATGSGTNTSRFAADDHVHEGVYSVGVSNLGNSAGDTRVGPGRMVLAGANAVTLSQATAANALNTVSIVGPASATTISAVESANVIGTRGSRFALEDHQHAGVFSMGVTNAGNSAGDTRVGAGRFVLAGGANITLSQATAAAGLNTISIVGVSPSGGAFSGGVSNLGNTAGSTGISGTQLVLVGSGVISLSQSTGANGATVSVLAPTPKTYSMFDPYNQGIWVDAQLGNGSMYLMPMIIPNIQFDRIVNRVVFSNSSNSTGSITITVGLGFYTRAASSQLSLYLSTSHSYALTFSGTVGDFSIQHGRRFLTYPWTTTLTENCYWAAFVSSTASAGTNASFSNYVVSQHNSSHQGVIGQTSASTNQMRLGQGMWTGVGTTFPATIAFSNIRGQSSAFQRPPAWFALSQSA